MTSNGHLDEYDQPIEFCRDCQGQGRRIIGTGRVRGVYICDACDDSMWREGEGLTHEQVANIDPPEDTEPAGEPFVIRPRRF